MDKGKFGKEKRIRDKRIYEGERKRDNNRKNKKKREWIKENLRKKENKGREKEKQGRREIIIGRMKRRGENR